MRTAVMGIALAGALSAPTALGDERSLLRELESGLRDTRVALTSGVIVWERTTTETGFLKGVERISRSTHEMTFDLDRVAVDTWCFADAAARSAGKGEPKLDFALTERWDGGTFYSSPLPVGPAPSEDPLDVGITTRPKFRSYANLLQEVFRSPAGSYGGISLDRLAPEPPAGATRVVSREVRDGQDAIRVSYARGEDRTDAWFDADRGYYKTHEDWYDAGKRTFSYSAELGVVDGVWLPVRVEMTSWHADGTPSLVNELRVDLSRTRLNHVAGFPDQAFRLTPAVGAEVSDYRSGDRVIYIVGRDAPDDAQMQRLVDKARALLSR